MMGDSDDIDPPVDAAAKLIASWIRQQPTETRLGAALKACSACSDYAVARELTEWVLAQPNCTAEMVLFYLGVMSVHELAASGWTEEKLRADPEWFMFVDGLIDGLRDGRYRWAGPERVDGREPMPSPVKAWRDVRCLQYCDLYRDFQREPLPEAILDAFEVLGSVSGERVAATAKKILIGKGYEPGDL